jgi:hypothetical protein
MALSPYLAPTVTARNAPTRTPPSDWTKSWLIRLSGDRVALKGLRQLHALGAPEPPWDADTYADLLAELKAMAKERGGIVGKPAVHAAEAR